MRQAKHPRPGIRDHAGWLPLGKCGPLPVQWDQRGLCLRELWAQAWCFWALLRRGEVGPAKRGCPVPWALLDLDSTWCRSPECGSHLPWPCPPLPCFPCFCWSFGTFC